jgi:hypothetical protein
LELYHVNAEDVKAANVVTLINNICAELSAARSIFNQNIGVAVANVMSANAILSDIVLNISVAHASGIYKTLENLRKVIDLPTYIDRIPTIVTIKPNFDGVKFVG